MATKIFALFFGVFLTLTPSASASLKLNISIIHKKGIDKGLVLVAELHSAEILEVGNKHQMTMKNGLALELLITFAKNPRVYGPSALLNISGQVQNFKTEKSLPFSEVPIKVRIGGKRKFIIKESEDQLIEITIRPEIL